MGMLLLLRVSIFFFFSCSIATVDGGALLLPAAVLTTPVPHVAREAQQVGDEGHGHADHAADDAATWILVSLDLTDASRAGTVARTLVVLAVVREHRGIRFD